MGELSGKVALVTGASRGIGRGIATTLARAGASVVLTCKDNLGMAQECVAEIVTDGGKAIATTMDQASRDDIRAAMELARDTFGAPDILVNNAAMAQEKPFEEITDEDWDTVLGVNLRGPFALSQEAIPHMKEQGWGRIINISSIGGQWGGFFQVHYAASKAALINFTRSLAKIYGPDNITTNAIAPGLVATDMSARELESDEGQQKVAGIPLGRLGDVDEVAETVLFLASDRGAYLTGQTLNLNGGMYFV